MKTKERKAPETESGSEKETAQPQDSYPIDRFPYTPRIQACEVAIQHRLHLIRDNHHMWAIREPSTKGGSYVQVWLCRCDSYDGLWRETLATLRSPTFDRESLPYAVKDTPEFVMVFDPRTGVRSKIPKSDLRRRRGE